MKKVIGWWYVTLLFRFWLCFEINLIYKPDANAKKRIKSFTNVCIHKEGDLGVLSIFLNHTLQINKK